MKLKEFLTMRSYITADYTIIFTLVDDNGKTIDRDYYRTSFGEFDSIDLRFENENRIYNKYKDYNFLSMDLYVDYNYNPSVYCVEIFVTKD